MKEGIAARLEPGKLYKGLGRFIDKEKEGVSVYYFFEVSFGRIEKLKMNEIYRKLKKHKMDDLELIEEALR